MRTELNHDLQYNYVEETLQETVAVCFPYLEKTTTNKQKTGRR